MDKLVIDNNKFTLIGENELEGKQIENITGEKNKVWL